MPETKQCKAKVKKKKVSNKDEEKLISAAKRGNSDAFASLYENSHRHLKCVLVNKFGPFEHLEDVVQTSYLKAFKAINRFKSDCSFTSWLVTIAVNTKRDWFRFSQQNEVRKAISLDMMLEEGFDAADIGDSNSAAAEFDRSNTDIYKKILELKSKLTKQHQKVFDLELVKGLTSNQIASKLRIPIGTVLSRSFYLKRKLRRLVMNTEWGKELKPDLI